jgi:hypothetical protein
VDLETSALPKDILPPISIERSGDAGFIGGKTRLGTDTAIQKAIEATKQKENMEAYQQLLELYPKVNERLNFMTFLRVARKLISRFHGNRTFFPSEKVIRG